MRWDPDPVDMVVIVEAEEEVAVVAAATTTATGEVATTVEKTGVSTKLMLKMLIKIYIAAY